MKPTKDLIVKGIKWSVTDQFGIYGIKLLFSVAIARALLPEDFGLIALIAIFIILGSQLTDSGFQMALIQKAKPSELDINTVFVFNIVSGLLIYLGLFLAAGPIAGYFGEPRLGPIVRVAGLNIVIGAFSSVQLALLSKKLDFKTQALVNFSSALASNALGLILAYSGFQYWALVLQTLSGTVLRTLLLWYKASWIPALAFSWRSFREMFSFGSKIMAANLVDTFFTNIYYPIIGVVYNTKALGYYERAGSFTNLYTKQISIAVSKVAFPAFANIQSDFSQLRRSYQSSIRMLTVFFFFATLCLIPTIEPLILLALTGKWAQIIPYMQLLILDAFCFPVYRLNINVLEAQGKSGTALGLDLAKKGLVLAGLLLTVNIGIEAIIYSILAASFLALVLSWFLVRNLMPLAEQAKLFLVHGAIALLVLAMQHGLGSYLENAWALAGASFLASGLILAAVIEVSPFESHRAVRALVRRALKGKP